jgi:hypothetical protein
MTYHFIGKSLGSESKNVINIIWLYFTDERERTPKPLQKPSKRFIRFWQTARFRYIIVLNFSAHPLMEKRREMERRSASHTEEEELNQRRRLLNLARKGDPKAIDRLFELYQVRVYTGDKLGKSGRLPTWPAAHEKPRKATAAKRPPQRRPARTRRQPTTRKSSRRVAHRR